jgi:hypothetical protein
MPSAIPEMITVAGPVWLWRAISLTVLYSSDVNHSEIFPTNHPTTRPPTTENQSPIGLARPASPKTQ